jgi:hypothetical protein
MLRCRVPQIHALARNRPNWSDSGHCAAGDPMQDLLPSRPFKRRRLYPRRPHPDVEVLLKRGHDRPIFWMDSFDDSPVLDRQDRPPRAIPGR